MDTLYKATDVRRQRPDGAVWRRCFWGFRVADSVSKARASIGLPIHNQLRDFSIRQFAAFCNPYEWSGAGSVNSYWLRRFRRHFSVALVAAAITYLAYEATPPPDVRHRLSMGTAYAALIYLAVSLWLGPWNVLRLRPNPISFDLRRDVGIWTGILAILHSAIGLTVHLRGRTWMYFFKRLHPVQLQTTQFGFANFTGLGAALLFLMLMAVSNDLSLRAMKTNSGNLFRDGPT